MMQSMTPFEFAEVILVPFPFTDQTTNKKRPAIIISSNKYNTDRPDTIIMAITSQLKSKNIIGEVIIQEWEKAGLLKASAIKPVITTIEKKLIIRKMGKLENKDLLTLQESLSLIIGHK